MQPILALLALALLLLLPPPGRSQSPEPEPPPPPPPPPDPWDHPLSQMDLFYLQPKLGDHLFFLASYS
jgi:hypothetical protein